MEELFKMLFGNLSVWGFIGFLIWALIGAFDFSQMELSDRNPQSEKTPRKFSLKFWIMDNWRRWLVTLILIFILFRFYPELTGQPLTEYTAFLTGFGSDTITGFTKRKFTLLQANREKLIQHNR
jgi:hypothetical protein